MRLRITQNFHETWLYVFRQAATFMTPMLLVLCQLHRLLCAATMDRKSAELDFTSTIAKLREQDQLLEGGARYDLFQDREQLTTVLQEVSAKGLVPIEYQIDILNFLIFWYYFSSFVSMSFALLYYRKYREN